MKLKLSEIKANPFKKQIDGGKLNPEQVQKLKSSIKDLGLMGTLPVVKIEQKYYLVSHHHRKQALKELGYKEVEVTVKKYSKEKLLRGMVIENLTHRSGEFREESQNCVVVRDFLNDNPNDLHKLRDSRSLPLNKRKHLDTQYPQPVAEDIARWIDPEKKVISHDKVNNLLNIVDNLDPSLIMKIEKTHRGSADRRTSEEVVSESQAVILARIKDKDEQKDIAKALHNSRENRVRDQYTLVTQYKQSNDAAKKAIREGKEDIADINEPLLGKEINLSRNKLMIEIWIDFRAVFGKLHTMMEELTGKTNDKNYLKKSSDSDLKSTYRAMSSWVKEDLLPFSNTLIEELRIRNGNGTITPFKITEEKL